MRGWYDKPYLTYKDVELEWGAQSGELYTLRIFAMDQGPKEWNIDLDTIVLPDWIRDVYAHRMGWREAHWLFLVDFDSLGNGEILWQSESPVSYGLALSPDENHFAYTTNERVVVWDRARDTTLNPLGSDEFGQSWYPSYSPDGSLLAYTTARSFTNGPGVVIITEAPRYDQIIHRFEFEPYFVPQRVSWSPDGEWLLVEIRDRRLRGRIFDLIAIEVATGEQVTIERPYLVDGRPDSTVYVSDELDWTD